MVPTHCTQTSPKSSAKSPKTGVTTPLKSPSSSKTKKQQPHRTASSPHPKEGLLSTNHWSELQILKDRVAVLEAALQQTSSSSVSSARKPAVPNEPRGTQDKDVQRAKKNASTKRTSRGSVSNKTSTAPSAVSPAEAPDDDLPSQECSGKNKKTKRETFEKRSNNNNNDDAARPLKSQKEPTSIVAVAKENENIEKSSREAIQPSPQKNVSTAESGGNAASCRPSSDSLPCPSKYHMRFSSPEKHGSAACPFCSVCHILERVFNGLRTTCRYPPHELTEKRVQSILHKTGFLTAGLRRCRQILNGERIGMALLQGIDDPVSTQSTP